MRRGTLRTAIVLAVLVLAGTSAPALGHEEPTSYQWTHEFDLGLDYQTSNNCVNLDDEACEQYLGISIHDISVKDQIADFEKELNAHPDGYWNGEIRWWLHDGALLGDFDEWRVCWYDDTGERLGCQHTDDEGMIGGPISWDTTTFRIILYENLDREASFGLYMM